MLAAWDLLMVNEEYFYVTIDYQISKCCNLIHRNILVEIFYIHYSSINTG